MYIIYPSERLVLLFTYYYYGIILGCSKHSRRFAGLEACFLLVTVRFLLFLVDKLRRKHHFKHANKKKTREDCCIVLVTCKTVAFRFFKHILK